MTRLLRSVRSKLMTLVGLSSLVALLVVPLIGWLMREAVLDEVDERVADMEGAFSVELADDTRDIGLAARMLAKDPEVKAALLADDKETLRRKAHEFHDIYKEFDVLFYEDHGRLLAHLGCAAPRLDANSAPELAGGLSGKPFEGVVAYGCETATGPKNTPPAWTVVVPVPGAGLIVACLPLDQDFARNLAGKTGVHVAIVSEDGTVFANPGALPTALIATANKMGGHGFDRRDGSLAWLRFDPKELEGAHAHVHVVAAMSVAGVEKAVHEHLGVAFAVIALAALISMAFGIRIANVMSHGLKRISFAYQEMAKQRYVKVPTITTGDELEDLATGFNTMVDGLQERDKLRTTMGKYMTEEVVAHLMAGDIRLGGAKLHVTVLFSDIRGFTSISERMSADELVGLLNEYFTAMVGIVMEEGGVVDKYIGDAIMVVFGAPVQRPDDSVRAVRAAVRMRGALAKLNESFTARGKPILRTGVGLHTGEVIAGNIGSEQRMEYTVIGDTVNLASRLESATKELGVDIAISEDTWREVQEHFVGRAVREITVKGREQPVVVYEVTAEKV